jgi:hypothetical protein
MIKTSRPTSKRSYRGGNPALFRADGNEFDSYSASVFFCILKIYIIQHALLLSYLISSNINFSLQKEVSFATKIKRLRSAHRPGCWPDVRSGCSTAGRSSGLLAGRSSGQRRSHENQKASVCLPANRPGCSPANRLGNIGATKIKRLWSGRRRIIRAPRRPIVRATWEPVGVAYKPAGVRATQFATCDGGASS